MGVGQTEKDRRGENFLGEENAFGFRCDVSEVPGDLQPGKGSGILLALS